MLVYEIMNILFHIEVPEGALGRRMKRFTRRRGAAEREEKK